MDFFNTLLSLIKERGLFHCFYVDRLHIYFDARVPQSDLLELKALSEKNLLHPRTLEGYIHLTQKLELFQLNADNLERLKTICETSKGDYKINYIELALDFYSKKKAKVKCLRRFFNKHLVQLGKSSQEKPYFNNTKGTHYYHRKKKPVRLVLYSKKPFRWKKGYSCVHLEYRYKGLDALRQLGIITINDIVNFDHAAFWQQQLDLRKPDFKDIGNYLAEQEGRSISNTALNKKGQRFFEQLSSLQKLFYNHPEFTKVFSTINTPEALNKFINQAFS